MENIKLTPFKATHPGRLIKEELSVRDDINQRELARQMEVKPSFLNEIINGKRSITADIAILLEKILGVPTDLWMKLQSQYEVDNARIKEKNIEKEKNIDKWKMIKNYVPVSYFKKKKYYIRQKYPHCGLYPQSAPLCCLFTFQILAYASGKPMSGTSPGV